MTYEEIVRENCSLASVPWWPKFAYHYTDVENAVSILRSGFLYSRANAQQLGLMRNDNASRQVIDMTQTEAVSCVRFYFRPLTPTQYYNEGYKHPQLRYDNDESANTPVPVFFLFNLPALLSKPSVKYSELPQSGYGAKLLTGSASFATLAFDKIYDNGFEKLEETKKYRRAEILHPNSMQLDDCLNTILCRNDIERITFLNLLKDCDKKSYIKYQGIIKICRENMFENNGLFITECRYHENVISISLSDSHAKQQYAKSMMKKNGVIELKPVNVRLELDWINARGVVEHKAAETEIDYQVTTGITVRSIPTVQNARSLRMKVFIEKKLMCLAEQPLEKSELIK